MVYEGILKGKFVTLKSATVDDAEFSLSIRQDPAMTKFLPKLNITLEQQKEWIAKQREKKDDYFFIVWSNSGKRLGTISVYNIKNKSAEGGRLALYGDPIEKIEANIMMADFEYDVLGLEEITGWVYSKNSPAIRWNIQFGAVFGEDRIDENGDSVRDFVITKENSKEAREKLRSIIYRLDV